MPFPPLSNIDYRFNVIGARTSYAQLANIAESANAAFERCCAEHARDDVGCHCCGNPDPGDKCRYCGVTSRHGKTVRMSPGNPARGVKWRYPIVDVA